MSLDLPHTTLSTTFVSTESDDNFAAVEDKFDGGITNADVSADAGISVSKIATIYQEVWLELCWHQGLAVGGANWSAVAVGAATPLDFVALPGSDTDVWICTDVSWLCTDTGTVKGQFDVRFGAYNGAGVWANAGSIVTAVDMPVVGAGNVGNQGRAYEEDASSGTTITQGATVRGLALMSAAQGTAVMDGGSDFLKVMVALRRGCLAA